ncbi:MAG: hypothetical protein E7236_00120 [Lachnospiraceae bacterium]|nr:hypothetical protein [Lachnospiraceae bacterium]
MSDNRDFEDMRELFEKDGLQAPESLSAEEMKKKLLAAGAETGTEHATEPAGPGKPRRRYVWGSIGAAAACVVAVIVAGNTVISPLGSLFAGSEAAQYGEMAAGDASGDGSEGAGSPGSGSSAGEAGAIAEAGGTLDEKTGMLSFSSYAELEGKVSQMVPEEEEIIDYETEVYDEAPGLGLFAGNGAAASKDTEIAAEEAPMAGAEADAETGAGEAVDSVIDPSSDTYTQVQGVDEADIVKTDDKYIYYTDTYNDAIYIIEANNGKTKPVGMIEARADEPVINDFYLYGDTLVSIGYEWDDKTDRELTTAVIYDISDRSNPVKINTYQQSGYLVSTRMVGKYLYLVTDYSFYSYGDDRYIPYVTGENGYDRMDIADICAFPDQEMPEYIIAGSVDVMSGAQLKTKAKAVLGGSQDIYCNTENLFVAGFNYRYYGGYDYYVEDEAYLLDDGTEISDGDVIVESDDVAEAETDMTAPQQGTRILKVSLNDGQIRFEASGMVEGYIDNQFSMDERNGYLRVATTSSDAHGYDINNLFVLDENLKQVGEVTGFAKNEHVEAVRYIGEKAYVITYEQTDPLFVIDVSDPTAPKIEGSVKIDGFSTLLVPTDENTLFGIGYATATTRFGEVQEGVKLVTFDISDPSQPKVNDAKEFLNTYSEVQYNHKALLKNAEADYYAIPYNQYDDEGYYFEHGGVLVVRIKNGKIQVLKDYQDMDTTIRRCVFIGDYIYTIDDEDQVGSFLMK